MQPDPVAELTVQVGRLTITVRETPAAAAQPSSSSAAPAVSRSASTASFELVSSPAPSVPLRSPDRAFFAATTAAELGALDLGRVQSLVGQLRGGDPTWTPQARIARAFCAGLVARCKLDGAPNGYLASPAVPGISNRHYVCLECESHPHGFWTTSSTLYFRALQRPRSGSVFGNSVSHALPQGRSARLTFKAPLFNGRLSWRRSARPWLFESPFECGVSCLDPAFGFLAL